MRTDACFHAHAYDLTVKRRDCGRLLSRSIDRWVFMQNDVSMMCGAVRALTALAARVAVNHHAQRLVIGMWGIPPHAIMEGMSCSNELSR
jgi:hypothetical protein